MNKNCRKIGAFVVAMGLGLLAGDAAEPGKPKTPQCEVTTGTEKRADQAKFPIGPDDPALARRVTAGELGFRSLIVVKRFPLRGSHIYDCYQGGMPGGGLYRLDLAAAGESVEPQLHQLVDAGKGNILDATLSYAGDEILFSWTRSETKRRHIYRIRADGTGLTQLTEGDHDNFNPAWLPDGGIAFLSNRLAQGAYCWRSYSAILYRMDRDGKGVVRLSAGHLQEFTPAVLDDGRLIYSRWEYVDREAISFQSLWTIRPDGTGLAGFFGNRVISPGSFLEARSIPGTSKVLCTMTGHGGQWAGAVGIIDPRLGANAQAAIHNVTPDVPVAPVDSRANSITVPNGHYENPFPLDATYFLVSDNGTVLLRNYAGTSQVTLLQAPPAPAVPAWKGAPNQGYYCAQPLRAVPVPPILPRQQDSSAPGVAAAPDGVVPTGRATLIMQDVYCGLEPDVQRGEITAIRVVQELAKPNVPDIETRAFGWMLPVVSAGATYAPKLVWGDAPVAADGSAYFEVPAGVPLHFLALDKEGRAVQRMRTFTHLMPGETQGCVGCHADRNYVAPTRPGAFSASSTQPPAPLVEPEWGVRGFSYVDVVQPVWDRHCVSCHNPRTKAGRLDLSGDLTDFFNVSYDNLIRQGTSLEDPGLSPKQTTRGLPPAAPFRSKRPVARYVRSIPSGNGTSPTVFQLKPRAWCSPASPLADLVLKGHPDKNGKPRVQLSAAEHRRVFAWIDLNIPYYPTAKATHMDLPGSRRLYPDRLEPVLAEVAGRRCVSCHVDNKGQPAVPRTFYVRLTHPELNDFLLAPLAKSAGGTEACGRAIFAGATDPDYQALLKTFQPIHELLQTQPREDCNAGVNGVDSPRLTKQDAKERPSGAQETERSDKRQPCGGCGKVGH